MLFLATLALAALVAFTINYLYINFRPGAPPGPLILPLVGSLQVVLKNAGKQICGCELYNELALKYGPIFYLRLGVVDSYVVTDLDLMKKALASEDWAERTPFPFLLSRSQGLNKGLIWGAGAEWREIRRYTIKTLIKFGFGKRSGMDSTMLQEMEHLKQDLLTRIDGQGFVDLNFRGFFSISTLNLIWFWMAAERFDRNDPEVLDLLHSVEVLSRGTPTSSNILLAFPFLIHVLPSTVSYWFEEHPKILGFIKKIMDKKRQAGTEDPEDFFQAFLKEIDERSKDERVPNYYTEDQLLMTALDLIMGGAETSSTNLEFGVLAMALNPHVQDRIRQEIEDVLGPSITPTFSDLQRLPYAHATTLEILRMANALPMSDRANLHKDAKVGDFLIPKGSSLYLNIMGHHLNPQVWGKPMEFDPTRFLGPENNIINADKIISFGHGKRVCPGELLGKAAIFTFLTGLVQSFKFEQIPGQDLSKCWMKFQDGFTLSTVDFKARVSRVKHSH